MAVSLVSTGVQFPDSTIQTTAASGGAATVVASYNFSGQTSVSWALDFSTYPGGYQLIWCNVYPGAATSALFVEFSGNSGSTWQGMTSFNSSAKQGTGAWTWSSNSSGYFAYFSNQWYTSSTGISMTMQLAAKNQPSGSYCSAITLSGHGFTSAADPCPQSAFGYWYTYGAKEFTNIRFTPTAGSFASGSLRVLGYK